MLGDITELGDKPSDNRGMTPRIFEYLFARIQKVRILSHVYSNFVVDYLRMHELKIRMLLAKLVAGRA